MKCINYCDLRLLFSLLGNPEQASNHVLIMDEVDGMAGNEDRGGMQVGVLLPYFCFKESEVLV